MMKADVESAGGTPLRASPSGRSDRSSPDEPLLFGDAIAAPTKIRAQHSFLTSQPLWASISLRNVRARR